MHESKPVGGGGDKDKNSLFYMIKESVQKPKVKLLSVVF